MPKLQTSPKSSSPPLAARARIRAEWERKLRRAGWKPIEPYLVQEKESPEMKKMRTLMGVQMREIKMEVEIPQPE